MGGFSLGLDTSPRLLPPKMQYSNFLIELATDRTNRPKQLRNDQPEIHDIRGNNCALPIIYKILYIRNNLK
jgi:hypothetical protein